MKFQTEIKNAVDWDAPSVGLESSLRDVIQKLVASKASALAVKIDDILVGVVTDIDIIDSISDQRDLDTTKVSEFLTPCELITNDLTKGSPCAQLDESESVENALKVLSVSGTHNLVVSGKTDKDVGIASIRDLLHLLIS